jgi:hypothetical protein
VRGPAPPRGHEIDPTLAILRLIKSENGRKGSEKSSYYFHSYKFLFENVKVENEIADKIWSIKKQINPNINASLSIGNDNLNKKHDNIRN